MNNRLSENLKRLRFQRGNTQKELAIYLHLSNSTISNYENGVNEPCYHTLSLLADFYGVSIDYLVGRQYAEIFQHRAIYGEYTIGRFLRLLDALPYGRLSFLVDFLVLLENSGDF